MHRKYLTELFLKKIFLIFFIFLCLTFVLNLFEEVSFFKNIDSNIFLPIATTALNSPSIMYLIFPFIFLISTQLLFLELIEKNELDLFKINGVTNLKIVSFIALVSFVMGIFIVIIFYNFSSKLKFIYLELKNNYSFDNKYLAVINQNGLWIKDKVNNETLIINATKIDNATIKNVTVSVYDDNFEIKKIISSPSANISNNNWILDKPVIFIENKTLEQQEDFVLYSNFNVQKINSLFSNLTALNFYQLYQLKKDYMNINYSYNEIDMHIKKLISFPFYLTIMSILSSIIMLNIKRNSPQIVYLLIGIFSSVFIYYINVLSQSLGKNGAVPMNISIWMPILILSILIIIGLIRINEK